MPDHLLSVERLSSGYGRIPILFGIDLRIAPGEFLGILGHNGMGKTTLLRTLMGHLPATGGRIFFKGAEITKASPARRSQSGIGYVPQGRQIFPSLSVLENLRIAAHGKTKAEVADTVDRALQDFPRLESITNRTGGVLSGGEQQILALARCLCADPSFVMLDEPTEGIQPSIIEEMIETLKVVAKARDTSFLLVEQNLDFIAELSTRVLSITRGQLSGEIDRDSLYHAGLTSDPARGPDSRTMEG